MRTLRNYFNNIAGYYLKEGFKKSDLQPSDGAVSELIYHSDCSKIFDRFEDEILDLLDDYDVKIFLDYNFKTQAVWVAWELIIL